MKTVVEAIEQENFFHPDQQDLLRYGAGDIPVRTRDDYAALYQATQHAISH
jgi:hypothetical protein